MKRWKLLSTLLACLAILPLLLETDLTKVHHPLVPGLREAWHATVRSDDSATTYASDRYLVTPSQHGNGLTVWQIATGQQVSEIPKINDLRNFKPEEIRIVDTTMVVAWGGTEDDTVLLRGYEVSTGRQLWHRSFTQKRRDFRSPVALTDQAAVIFSSSPVEARAFEIHTGIPLWSLPTSEPLKTTSAVFTYSNRSFFVFRWDRQIRGLVTLASLDPFSGTRRWQRLIPMPTDPETHSATGDPFGLNLVTSPGGDIAVNINETHQLYAADGRLLGEGANEIWSLTSLNSMLYASIRNQTRGEYDPSQLRAIRVKDGKTLWERESYAHSLEPWGSALVGQTRQDWPMPIFIEQVTADNGYTSHIPLAASIFHTDLIGIGGRFMVTREDTALEQRPLGDADVHWSVLTVYSTTPPQKNWYPALAGLRPSDWPNACNLLHADVLASQANYTAVPQRRSILGIQLPHPAACTYVPKQGNAPLIRLSIEWIAPSEKMADQLIRSRTALARVSAKEIRQLGPQRISYTEEPPSGVVYAVYVRVGTAVVRITTTPTDRSLAENASTAVMRSGDE
ncbi:PQQ-binding-like beta-propeller repeat protein [Streptomyces mauvecolor]|uniref:PQQ-binding-like beta-propeller repeat protein n=1 Tax=Streptomyces mauvecolor TaxID=58345 RepID=A0ABV9V0C8_9ACTN